MWLFSCHCVNFSVKLNNNSENTCSPTFFVLKNIYLTYAHELLLLVYFYKLHNRYTLFYIRVLFIFFSLLYNKFLLGNCSRLVPIGSAFRLSRQPFNCWSLLPLSRKDKICKICSNAIYGILCLFKKNSNGPQNAFI